MKTIILVRHAKSSHTMGVSSDFERPLNDRGFREASEMGKNLFKKNTTIDLFVSSPALRAKTTAELFAAEYDRKMKEIRYDSSLYHASPEVFSAVIGELEDSYRHVALFSHNPGISDFACSLCNSQITHMPTSSVFAVKCPVDTWKEFEKAEKRFLFFYRPE